MAVLKEKFKNKEHYSQPRPRRVGAFNLVGAYAFGPVAFAAAGPVAAALGARIVLGFGAAWSACMTLAVLAAPAVRREPWPEESSSDVSPSRP